METKFWCCFETGRLTILSSLGVDSFFHWFNHEIVNVKGFFGLELDAIEMG